MRCAIWLVTVLALACLSFAVPLSARAESNQSSNGAPSETDFNQQIYYKNKLEFAYDTSYLFYNVPLLFDPFLGEKFARVPGTVNYTLLPLIGSLRWQLYNPCGPSFLRGNTDVTFGGSYTVITQGPESRYIAVITGVRYNFVQPNWRLAPYFEIKGGMGFTDAEGPEEVASHQPQIGQGQDFTFTFLMGAGVRYNFNPRYSVSAGVEYMHMSNANLSEPRYYNHGINVVGPTVGINVAIPDHTVERVESALGSIDDWAGSRQSAPVAQ